MKQKKGFTLIETLIYAILVATIISGVLISVYQMIQGSATLNTRIVAEEEVNFIFRKIVWALAGAYDINSPGTGDTGTTLSVDKENFSDNPIVLDLNSGNLRIKRGGEEAVILNNEHVAISNATFEHLASSGDKPGGIKVNIFVDNQAYETTIYLRK